MSIRTGISSIVAGAEAVLRAVSALCLVGLTGLVVVQVALRYGFGSVPFFIEEVARYLMIWMALLAAAVGVREASHIRIDFVPTALGAITPRGRAILEIILDIVALTSFLVLVWYGVDMVLFARGQTSDGLRIPLSYPYGAVPISFFIASIFALLRVIDRRAAR